MSCKIVIPSHKRADRVITKNIVSDTILCVSESQEEEYKLYNPEIEIVTHPDSVIGLVPKRNWMMKHFGELFMMDDDITSFHSLHIKDANSVIKDRLAVNMKIQELYQLAKYTGINLFGFTKSTRPEQYNVFKPFSLCNQITGCAYGIINDGKLYWPEELKLKEDVWISCYCKYINRKILIDNRYNFVQKDTMINAGGLSEIRNGNTELESILYIKKHFGDSIVVKRDQKYAKSKKKYNISTKFRY